MNVSVTTASIQTTHLTLQHFLVTSETISANYSKFGNVQAAKSFRHALDVIGLDYYYAKYPVSDATLSCFYRIIYRKLHQQFIKHGFSKNYSLLNSSCGANALFLHYVQQKGFTNCYGYEPYDSPESFGNSTLFQQKLFNSIWCQNVIEYVDNPNALLSQLNHLLAPSGYILIGTPNPTNNDLTRPDVSGHYNPIHAPYRLHLYTAKSLESLGCRQERKAVEFFYRLYYDLPFVLNPRAWNEYQRFLDATLNVALEPIKTWKALTSYKELFYTLSGYWLSFKTDMNLMFCKSF